MNRELLQQAVDAFKHLKDFVTGSGAPEHWDAYYPIQGDALDALEAELAKPEQEPVGFVRWSKEKEFFDTTYAPPRQTNQSCSECGKKESDGWALYCVECVEKASKPEQEPVAWTQEDRIVPEIGYECTMTKEHPKDLGYSPLYTAPPRKQWVGLTDDDITQLSKLG